MDDAQRDIVVLGYSADVEALFRHLDLEAPAMLRRIIVIDPRPEVLEPLQRAARFLDELASPSAHARYEVRS